MDIIDEDGKTVIRGGEKCCLYVSSSDNPEGDCRALREAYERGDIEYLVHESAENAGKWIGSTDYRAQTLSFAAEFREHYEEITESFKEERSARLCKEIGELEKKLASCGIRCDADDVIAAASVTIDDKPSIWEKDLLDLKPESSRFADLTKRVERHNAMAVKYRAIIA